MHHSSYIRDPSLQNLSQELEELPPNTFYGSKCNTSQDNRGGCGFNKHAVKLRMHKAALYAFPIPLNTF